MLLYLVTGSSDSMNDYFFDKRFKDGSKILLPFNLYVRGQSNIFYVRFRDEYGKLQGKSYSTGTDSRTQAVKYAFENRRKYLSSAATLKIKKTDETDFKIMLRDYYVPGSI